MSWAAPGWLLLLPAVLAAGGIAEWASARRRRRIREALHAAPGRGERLRSALVLAAASTMVVGLAGPGGAPVEPSPDGRGPLVLLLDVSRSMAVRDVAPSRALVARMAALRLATEAPGMRVGVAAFAADAHLLVPPTDDRGLVTLYVESLDPEAMTGQGSDLARALEVAVEAAKPGGTVALLSDGEGFQDEASLARALASAREAGVIVHTVAVGTTGGGDVPGVLTGGISRAEPDVLARIARDSGGTAVAAGDAPGVARLLSGLGGGGMGGAAQGGPGGAASWPALLALAALLAESLVGARRREVTP